MVYRKNPPTACGAAGGRVRTAIDHATGARASGIPPAAIWARAAGRGVGLVGGAGPGDRRWPGAVRHQCRRSPRLSAARCRSRGLFGIRVVGYHSDERPEKYAFSVNVSARCSACKINGFCVLLAEPFFDACSPRILVVIGITERTCNILFLSHVRLVILFRAYPEHTPVRLMDVL